jgi:hypothetical protein
MMHPNCELKFVNEQVGMGVFATAFIPKGSIVYADDPLDIVLYPDDPILQNPILRPTIDKYAVIEPGDKRVLAWDIARYVNHCCQANIMSTGYGFEIALRDIQPGEEIRDEYGIFNLGWTMELSCSCPEKCRGYLRPDDFDHFYAVWDEQLRAALQQALSVAQPLWGLLSDETAATVTRYIKTGEGYKSVLALKMVTGDR